MAKGLLDELIERVTEKPAAVKRRLKEEVAGATSRMRWIPNPGPQTDAYLSEAEIALYGGQAGGGKSHLMLGWGINEADSGIIFRRELTQTDNLERDGKEILGHKGFNGSDHEWTMPGGRTLKLGGMRDADSWQAYAGRERDFLGYDEAGEFLEIQIASMFAWLRAPHGKRTRMVLASNPPRTSDGYWMFEWFGPWIDESNALYPTPPGHLRWGCYVGKDLTNKPGQMYWVDGPGEYEIDGEHYSARSFTFIPASLEDNPYRNTPEYRRQLQNLPEPLRSQLLKGDFKAGMSDQAFQVIPSVWVRAAQSRWLERKGQPPDDIPMCAVAIDPTGGGTDDACIAQRFDSFFPELIKIPAKEVPQNRLGTHQAGLVVTNRRDNADVIVDMGGGYGGAILNHLSENNDIEAIAYRPAASTTRRTQPDGKYGFTNVRSAAYWKMREDLDPDQPGGSRVCLPPDKRLMAGLCAPIYYIRRNEIQVEPKSKNEGGTNGILERLGWSPNEADAVVMANWAGPTWATHAGQWIDGAQERATARGMRGMQPKVVLGHSAARRRR